MPRVLKAPEACLAVKTGCRGSSGLLPSMVASARPVEAVRPPASWLMGEASEPTEELLWKSAVSSGIHGVIGCVSTMFVHQIRCIIIAKQSLASPQEFKILCGRLCTQLCMLCSVNLSQEG